jgi:hypothetical protein
MLQLATFVKGMHNFLSLIQIQERKIEHCHFVTHLTSLIPATPRYTICYWDIYNENYFVVKRRKK